MHVETAEYARSVPCWGSVRVEAVTKPRYSFLDHPGPIPFAHRGGALEAPENSWSAFERAVGLGYRYIESDVHATRDGVVVTIHDADMRRVAGRPGLIREMSWSELSGMTLADGRPVPRLDEALSAWPALRWNLDAKHDSVVAPLVDAVRRASAIERVCLTSFDDRRIWRMRRALGPRLCVGMGAASITAMRLASLSPLGSRAKALGVFGAAQVPLRQGRVPVLDRRFLETCHQLGVAVHVWTVDDPLSMDRVLDLGADGVMTDRPTALKEVLVRRGQWA